MLPVAAVAAVETTVVTEAAVPALVLVMEMIVVVVCSVRASLVMAMAMVAAGPRQCAGEWSSYWCDSAAQHQRAKVA